MGGVARQPRPRLDKSCAGSLQSSPGLGVDSLQLGVIEWFGGNDGWIMFSGNIHFPLSAAEEGLIDGHLRFDHHKANGAAQGMAVRCRANVPDWNAVAPYTLGVEHERLGILHQHLDEAASQRALGPVSEHRFLADEAARFPEIERKTEARFVRHIGIVDVVAVVAVTLFHAQT